MQEHDPEESRIEKNSSLKDQNEEHSFKWIDATQSKEISENDTWNLLDHPNVNFQTLFVRRHTSQNIPDTEKVLTFQVRHPYKKQLVQNEDDYDFIDEQEYRAAVLNINEMKTAIDKDHNEFLMKERSLDAEFAILASEFSSWSPQNGGGI
ncbi:hypothetical protein KDW99_09025 [Marinomonas rhizomae]|uniref:hypothetical protein n=1 Tax=Marinomonas rhizomae TaxID=491948 RepID=UPI002106A270|nr:hypothetical protein [Marinomonas rhizomae]UTW01250.1 hypothetical protein KDW99_09025 [Marinomonas rhizomae]